MKPVAILTLIVLFTHTACLPSLPALADESPGYREKTTEATPAR
jgi:hypothetical protein